MGLQTFSKSILSEITSTRFALIVLLEKRDKLLFVDAPTLKNEYMLKIGTFEQQVLETELNAKMLARKLELIQIAKNQRKEIDMREIDAQIENERRQLLSELNKKDISQNDLPNLNNEEKEELQTKYKQIIASFHPSVNTNITDTQSELYEKANAAYRQQNLDILRIVYDMLFDTAETLNFEVEFDEDSVDLTKEYAVLAEQLATDYRLAKEIFACFEQTEDDLIFLRLDKQYNAEREQYLAEIENMLSAFPFNAKRTLDNKNLVNQYIEDLKLRLKLAEKNTSELTDEIITLTGVVTYERQTV